MSERVMEVLRWLMLRRLPEDRSQAAAEEERIRMEQEDSQFGEEDSRFGEADSRTADQREVHSREAWRDEEILWKARRQKY